MLVLSRKTGQKIHLGPDIVITVVEVSGKSVRLGVSAPKNINILRGELKEQIEVENLLAAARSGQFDGLKKIGSFLNDLYRNKRTL